MAVAWLSAVCAYHILVAILIQPFDMSVVLLLAGSPIVLQRVAGLHGMLGTGSLLISNAALVCVAGSPATMVIELRQHVRLKNTLGVPSLSTSLQIDGLPFAVTIKGEYDQVIYPPQEHYD